MSNQTVEQVVDTTTQDEADDLSQSESESESDTSVDSGDDSTNSEAARYRRRLRDTETERDALREQVAGFQRREVESLAASCGVRAGAIWAVAALGDLLGDDGSVDAARVASAVDAAREQLGVAPSGRAPMFPVSGISPPARRKPISGPKRFHRDVGGESSGTFTKRRGGPHPMNWKRGVLGGAGRTPILGLMPPLWVSSGRRFHHGSLSL